MPVAIAAAGIGAAGAVYGASQQAGAVNSASKGAQRIAEENRIVNNQNLQNTLLTVGPRLEGAGSNANAAVGEANDLSTAYLGNAAIAAGGALGAGYGGANDRLSRAGQDATTYLDTANLRIGQGVGNANALLQPYIDTGNRALTMTGDLSGANGVDAGRAALANFQATPAYQFNLDQGLRAIDAGAAQRGMLVSGGTRRAEQTFGAGLASQEFGNYYQRLSGLATQGLQASNTAGANIINGAGAQAGIDTKLADSTTRLGVGLASNDINLGTGLANIHTGLGNALSNNEMNTGNRLSQNELQTGANISNLYTGNATAQAANNNTGAGNVAQTLTSGGTALANIYGGQSQGIGNAINSGMNNYAYMNALGPQNGYGNYSTSGTVSGPNQQMLQTGVVDPNSGVVIR